MTRSQSSENTYIEKIISIIKELQTRETSWQKVAKNIIKGCNLPITVGFDSTIALMETRLLEESKETQLSLFDFLEEKYLKLKRIYIEYLLSYQKVVRFYRIDPKRIGFLIEKILSSSISFDGDFSQSYPLSVLKNQLSEMSLDPEIVSIEKTNNGLAIVICSKRIITQQIDIKISDFKDEDEVQERMLEFSRIFGVRDVTSQFFDIVFLNNETNTIEVRLDIHKNFGGSDQKEAFEQVISCFDLFLKKLEDEGQNLQSPINCFPLIETFYEAQSEGKVGELHFKTDQGSIKHEKMRTGSCDLREELYHRAGRQALEKFDQTVNPYRIAILWDLRLETMSTLCEIKSSPELFIKGRASHLSDPEKTLDEVLIRNCTCLEDYDYVVKKIYRYL